MNYTPSQGPQGPEAYPSLVARSIVVTGGGQGIGRCLSLALAERGANVLITAARDLSSLQKTVSMSKNLTGQMIFLQADIREPEECARTVALAISEFGSIDCLINNAARGIVYVREATGGRMVPFWESDHDRWAETMITNVIGTYFMSALAGKEMVENGFGRIINVSTSDRSMIREKNTPYGPSKAALEAMSVALANEAQDKGVTVNVLLPGGATKTRMLSGVTKFSMCDPFEPEVMNTAALWLCSDDSKGYTGGRYIGCEWDPFIEPLAAAVRSRQLPQVLPSIM